MKSWKFDFGLGITIVLITLMSFGVLVGFWDTTEFKAYDMWFRVRGVQQPPKDIVILGIDDESMKRIGRFPWKRDIHAQLLEKLTEAKLVAFDLEMTKDATPEEDNALAEAVGKHGRVVLASYFSFEREGSETYQVPQFPVRPLLQKTFSAGFVNVPTEIDNVNRRAVPVTILQNNRPFPSFALAVAMAEEGLTPNKVQLDQAGNVIAGKIQIPRIEGKGPFINYWGPAHTFTTIPYYQALEGIVPADYFKGKIVLIGPDSAVLKDDYHTPFTQGNIVSKGALPTPGVELHANALQAYREGAYFHRVSLWVNISLLVVFGLVTYVLSQRRKPWQALMIFLGLAMFWVLVNSYFWWEQKIWVNMISPMVTGLLTFLSATVYNLVNTEMERKRIQGMFGRYVSPAVVNQLLENPQMINLGGQQLDVTVIFSDIRGFTSFSEGKLPEEVVSRLNEYFSKMTAIVFKHNGSLDKYLGDGLMAVFGIPIPNDTHARNAIEAAKEMYYVLQEMNKVWQERGEKPFDIGVGVNSGPVLVGNIGSEERMEYTVIGEDVNLSARLESMNKEQGTRIIVSERTLGYLREEREEDRKLLEELAEIGAVSVRGMVQPVKIYTVPAVNEGLSKAKN